MGVPADNSEAAEDARRLGFPEEMVAAIVSGGEAGDTEIWPENWEIFVAFVSVSTQWRAIGLGIGHILYLGLDYAAALPGLAAAGVEVTPDLWRGIRMMEDAARGALNGMRR